MDAPETRYVSVGDADVAYQVVGDGPLDLVFMGGAQHIDVQWEHPVYADFLRRLASFSRLILLDRRGWGASDPMPDRPLPTWEAWAEDVDAVLTAVGADKAVLLGITEGGPISVLFASMHPERVRALILGNTMARWLAGPDYPIGQPADRTEAVLEAIRRDWGTPEFIAFTSPSEAANPELLRLRAKVARAAATPRRAEAQYRYMLESVDVRQALGLIQAPTLVLHTSGNPIIPPQYGRWLAENIAGATFVEIASNDYVLHTDPSVADTIAEFVTGHRLPIVVDRILATILFTDIVGSTQRAAALGDRRWRLLLDGHDRAVREQLQRFRGREIKATGDGFLASFDGPGRAIECATAIVESTRHLDLEVRVGLHTGECDVRGDDLGGLAVHIAARVGALAEPGEVLVSGTVRDLVAGSSIQFAERGKHDLKGVPGTWSLFAVRNDG